MSYQKTKIETAIKLNNDSSKNIRISTVITKTGDEIYFTKKNPANWNPIGIDGKPLSVKMTLDNNVIEKRIFDEDNRHFLVLSDGRQIEYNNIVIKKKKTTIFTPHQPLTHIPYSDIKFVKIRKLEPVGTSLLIIAIATLFIATAYTISNFREGLGGPLWEWR